MKKVFGMRIECEKAHYSTRKTKERDFYFCSFDDGKYYLHLNLNTGVGNCSYSFGLDKYADHFGEKGDVDVEAWSINLEPTRSLNKFHEIVKIINTSKEKTKEEFEHLLKDYLEENLFFPSSGPHTNKYYAGAKFSRFGVSYMTDFEVICPCALCTEDRFKSLDNKNNYSAKELSAFSNGSLF